MGGMFVCFWRWWLFLAVVFRCLSYSGVIVWFFCFMGCFV